jgi:predicted nucleotidyltransferase
MQHYIQLFRALHDAEVDYLICGGLAVNVYGIPRVTADIDLMLDFNTDNLKKFKSVTAHLSYQACIPLDIETLVSTKVRKNIVEQKNLIAYSFYNTHHNFMNLDVLVRTPFSFEYLWKKKSVRRIDNFQVYLVSLEDLIAMKNSAGRKQDLEDVEILKKLGNIDESEK